MTLVKISENLRWDSGLCKLCNLCVLFCPQKSLEFKDGKLVQKGECAMCGMCEKFCPDLAIGVVKDEKADAGK